MVIYEDVYSSWISKEEFETNYHETETPETIIIIEIKELEENLTK